VTSASSPAVREIRFRGEPGIRLHAGAVEATFLPGLGLTGVSLRHGRHEFLALPGGLDTQRRGGTGGLPLLAPWANRLSRWDYRVGRRNVDLNGLPLHTDGRGLPIHGLICGTSVWSVERHTTRRSTASFAASLTVDAPAFPFEHRLDVTALVSDAGLRVSTTLTATGRRSVPVGFGWHPYLRLPGARRGDWTLHLPERDHLGLDDGGIPNGRSLRERADRERVGTRTFDDLYRLRNRRPWSISHADDDASASLSLHLGDGYDYAQVWVPKGQRFLALEPMTVPTDALVRGETPIVSRGDSYTATFELRLDASV
jgi:aldose 1-epimerase